MDDKWTAVRATEHGILIVLATWRQFHWPSPIHCRCPWCWWQWMSCPTGSSCSLTVRPGHLLKFPWVFQVRERKFSAILTSIKLVRCFMRQKKGMVWCNWFTQADLRSHLQAEVTPSYQEGCNVIQGSLLTSTFPLVSANFGNADHVIDKICRDKN